MNQRHRLIRLVGWAMLLAVALGLGWSKAVSIWVRSQSGDIGTNDRVTAFVCEVRDVDRAQEGVWGRNVQSAGPEADGTL